MRIINDILTAIFPSNSTKLVLAMPVDLAEDLDIRTTLESGAELFGAAELFPPAVDFLATGFSFSEK